MVDFKWFLNRQGIQGRKGEKGDTGFSPTISVGTDTLDEYKLIIANESNSFETPNLRGNINISDNGGTYLRYDTETKQISAQNMDAATADTIGGVRLSTEADIVEMGAGSVVTPSDVADALPLYLEGEGAVTITQDELTSKTKIKVDVPSVNDLESRMSTAEAEIADIQTDVVNLNNNKVAKTDLATTESAGVVKVDGTSITVTADGTISASPSGALPIASTTQLGGVKVDGTSIIADENGVISSVGGGSTGDTPIATTTTAGKVKPDGTTITITDDGTISAVGGGGGATPTNMVTTDSDQTINGTKIFANGTGTVFTGTSSNSNSVVIDGDDKEIRFDSANQSDAVIKNQGWNSANLNIGTNFNSVKITTTLYDKNGNEIVGGSASGDVPIATTTTAGKVKPDGTTITVAGDGTISAVPTTPTNMVTTDTEQTITANKTFSTSSIVTFGAGLAQTSIHNDVITIGGTAKDLVFGPGSVPNSEGGTVQAGRIKSNTGIINIVPDWSNQSSGDGIVLSKDSLLFNNNEVLTKADIATDTTAGIVKVDGTSVTIDSNGVISATGGGSAPDNMVTTDTSQTISGAKTFTQPTVFQNTLDISTGGTDTLYIYATGSYAQGYTTDIKFHKNLNIKGQLSGGAITLAPYGSSLNALKYKDSSNTSNPSYDILHTGNLVTGNNITISEPNSTGVRTISGPSNEYMASMAMPSNRYVNLTLGASGATYTAPADGYVAVSAKSTQDNSSVQVIVNASSNLMHTFNGISVGAWARFYVPVRKSQNFSYEYNGKFATNSLVFVYAVGSESEAS